MSTERTSPGFQDDSVKILPPDFSLKKKIGANVNISEIFTPERIEAAQKTINDTQSEFISWAAKDLTDLEHAYHAVARDPATAPAAKIDAIRRIAFSLKAQSGTFGFNLGSEVAKSLYDYMMKHTTYSAENITVIRKHLDALQVIFQQNIQGDGAAIGAELMQNLHKLVTKFE